MAHWHAAGAVEITLSTRPDGPIAASVNRKMAPVTNIPTTIAASIPEYARSETWTAVHIRQFVSTPFIVLAFSDTPGSSATPHPR